MKDIENRADIELMVNTFYDLAQQDKILAPIFQNTIGKNWTEHLDTMYRFWQTILLHQFAYKGSPFASHKKLPIDQKHFDRWLSIFNTSMDTNFKGKVADEGKWRAGKMAQMFMEKLNINNY